VSLFAYFSSLPYIDIYYRIDQSGLRKLW